MLETIRRVLAGGDGDEQPTSAQIEDAIEAAEADLKRAEARVTRLSEAYADVLLEGSDKAAADHEAKAAGARREVARLQAALPRLEQRLEQERLAEREAFVQSEVEKAMAARDEGIELLRNLEEQWTAIVSKLERLKEIDREIEAAQRLHSERLPGRSIGQDLKSPNIIVRPFNKPLYETVVLPALSEDGARWGGYESRFQQKTQIPRFGAPAPLRRPSVTVEEPAPGKPRKLLKE